MSVDIPYNLRRGDVIQCLNKDVAAGVHIMTKHKSERILSVVLTRRCVGKCLELQNRQCQKAFLRAQEVKLYHEHLSGE